MIEEEIIAHYCSIIIDDFQHIFLYSFKLYRKYVRCERVNIWRWQHYVNSHVMIYSDSIMCELDFSKLFFIILK